MITKIKKNMPSVLLLINGFFPKIGGAEKQAEMLALALINKGCKVQILTLKNKKYLKENDVVNGISIKRLSYPFIPIFGTLIYMIKLFIYLFRTRRDWDAYYVVIVEYFALAASLAGHIWRKPVVLKFTGVGKLGVEYIKQKKLSSVLDRVLRRADAYIAVSREMEIEIKEYGFSKEKVHYLPNGVDCLKFHPPIKDEKKRSRHALKIMNVFTVVYTGRFVTVKDIPTLLRAWKLFIDKGVKAQLVLIGDGKLLDEMKIFANELGIIDSTFFIGKQSDIDLVYRAMDMGIISSLSEGLSNVLLEMMAGGILVVATDIEGNSLLVKNQENGFLYNPSDYKTLSKIMYKVYLNPDKYRPLTVAARDKVVAEFSINALAHDYINLFSEIKTTKIRNNNH